MDPAEAKLQAEALVRVAETLVSKAQEEAESIVRDGQRRVSGIVSDADSLRNAAEQHASAIRQTAERILTEARAHADEILAEAHSAREQAIANAQSDLLTATSPTPTETPADAQYAIQEASEVADRILRVARSEAEARSRTITEDARRKAELIERDARARAEAADKEHRETLRTMQQRELSAKARVRELDAEIARLERLLARAADEAARKGLDADPAADPVEPREVTASGIIFPPTVTGPRPAQARPTPVTPSDERPNAPTIERPRTIERVTTRPQPARREDLDADRVRRGIRRRA